MDKIGLVLEGGGMRCVFTAGVVDYFMDHNIVFPYVAGVSAGAGNALCYLAHQPRREKQCLIDLYEKYHYISLKNLIVKHSLFDFDLVFDEFSKNILPFDFDTFFNNKETECEIVTSNCVTGEANYYSEHESPDRLNQICKASCSLPVIMPMRVVDGYPMLDGGISDPVPLQRAISKGCKRNVVVLTRPYGHVSKLTNLPLPSFLFHKYPKIRAKMIDRGKRYNEQLRMIEEMERKGEVLVFRPKAPMMVSTVERNTDRLRQLYAEGYEAAKTIHAFLADNGAK